MNPSELSSFVRDYTTPTPLDIEMAKRRIVEYLSLQPSHEAVQSESLKMQAFPQQFSEQLPTFQWYSAVQPDLNTVKREIVTAEAIQSLHSIGALVALGPPVNGNSLFIDTMTRKHTFQYTDSHGTHRLDTVIYVPSVYSGYRLSAAFREQNFRLASGDIYLSYLDQTLLHSRAKRCLRESIDAFKSGLYLSSSMLVGAASESLWMRLGRLLVTKTDIQSTQDGNRLSRILKKNPQISEVIDTTWEVINNHRITELKSILPRQDRQESFKEHADRLRDRRNYATHDENANEEELRFTHIEAGMLLLDANEYFNTLGHLIAAVL